MLLPTPQAELSKFATTDGLSFQLITDAELPQFVAFVAERVLARDEDAGELSVPIGLAAEIKAQADDVQDEVASLVLGLASQDFDPAHKLPLSAESERDQARQIIELAEQRGLSAADKQALYDLVARALIRCGHEPSQVLVPEDRRLTPDETLELWVSYRLRTPVEAVNELVARFQAHHNPLADHLFRAWRVIVDRDLRAPMSMPETHAARPAPFTPPGVAIVYTSNDISQTASTAEPAEKNGAAKPAGTNGTTTPKPRGKRHKDGPLLGPPRPRISSAIVTFIGKEGLCKSSLLLDAILCRLAGVPRAAGLTPGMHAQAFARRHKDRLDRTKQTPAFDFNVATATDFFGGRANMGVTIKDIDGQEYHPETFGQGQCQHVQSADGLIIPIDTEALRDGGEFRAAEDALFLSRLVEQYRYRSGLPIAVVIPASDKLMSEAELAGIINSRLFPAECQRPLLTAVATRSIGRLAGSVAERMRHAAVQNPCVARSLTVLRLVDRLFARYEPLFREAAAITGSIEVFFTVTSAKESGWSRTYGSVEVIQWIASKLESQIRPVLPTLVSRERARLTGAQAHVRELQDRIDRLEARREAIRRRREASTTARIVFPWNKPERLQAQDNQAEDAIGTLLVEIEGALGIQAQARSGFAARRTAIAAARRELEARISVLAAV